MTDDQAKQAFWDAVEDLDPASMEIAQDIALERGWKLWVLGENAIEPPFTKIDGAPIVSRGSFTFGNWRTEDGISMAGWTVVQLQGHSDDTDADDEYYVRVGYEFQHSDWESTLAETTDIYEDFATARNDAAQHAWRALWSMKKSIARGGTPFERKRSLLTALANDALPVVPKELVSNPAWLTTAIADVYDVIQSKVPPEWLPKLDAEGKRGSLVATMKELGCGAYGCVIPTLDPSVVLKATTDTTETEFAAKLGQTLVVPVVVEYYMVVALSARWNDRRISLLWRESADEVGNIGDVAYGPGNGDRALELIAQQHRAASRVLMAIKNGAKSMAVLGSLFEQWVASLDKMASMSELAYVASGMKKVWLEQHIFLSDTHEGNLGLCKRGRDRQWVITDPGNVVVVET